MKNRTDELMDFCDAQALHLGRISVLSDALVNLLIERDGSRNQIERAAIFLDEIVKEAQEQQTRFTQQSIAGWGNERNPGKAIQQTS